MQKRSAILKVLQVADIKHQSWMISTEPSCDLMHFHTVTN